MNLILNFVYKPQRILFYIEPSKEQKRDFFNGIIPQILLDHDGKFGTYDCPGLFRMKNKEGEREVLGIEFRPDDDRIEYPSDMKSMVLNSEFMIYAFPATKTEMNDDTISEFVDYIYNNSCKSPFERKIKPKKDNKLTQVFTMQSNIRVFIQAEPVTASQFFNDAPLVTERENCLYNMAYRDLITGHYNWNYLQPIITAFGFKGIQDYCMAHFDVKDFNALNVLFGHNVANQLLTNVTKKLTEQDWIYYSARCDNDNFALMIKDMPDDELKAKLLALFESVSRIPNDSHYKVYYRCGVVPMRNCLLLGNRVADAGKLAQRLGNKLNKTEVIFYTDEMHDSVDWGTKIRAYLDTAIENDEFLVYLQPKYDVATEKIHGAEALVRWNFQNRGLLSPARFIPLFEKDGSIEKIDDIVLKKVCSYFKKWKEEGKPLYPISVNLSRKRLENPLLLDHLVEIVDFYGVEHSLIDFELTESAIYENQDYMIKVISALKAEGFKISMDDFGTGYSSLSLLTIMPIDTLKIDKSFIDPIGTVNDNQKACTVLQNVIAMGKALNLTCLTEGAEKKDQVEMLRKFGCELIQGFYYSKPLPLESYEKQMEKDGE